MTKITGGYLKGRNVKVLESLDLRPTTGFFRQWLYNILNNHIDFEISSMLELFSGSGAVSLEFISRGGKEVICVEKDSKVIDTLNKAFQELKIDKSFYQLYKRDGLEFIKSFSFENSDVNVLFLDPPYSSDLYDNVIMILENRFNDGEMLPEIIIIESGSKDKKDYSEIFTKMNYFLLKEKKSGNSKMRIYQSVNDD